MGSCQYYGKFSQDVCTVCLTVACKEHLQSHYYCQEHRIKAASNKNNYEWMNESRGFNEFTKTEGLDNIVQTFQCMVESRRFLQW